MTKCLPTHSHSRCQEHRRTYTYAGIPARLCTFTRGCDLGDAMFFAKRSNARKRTNRSRNPKTMVRSGRLSPVGTPGHNINCEGAATCASK